MDRIKLTDDEMRYVMQRVLHFYRNRRDYVNPNFVEHFHIHDFTDSDSRFLMDFYMVLDRTPNLSVIALIDKLLDQRRKNMEINTRQSNRVTRRNRSASARGRASSRGRAPSRGPNSRGPNSRIRPSNRIPQSTAPQQPARGRTNTRNRIIRPRTPSEPPSPPARSRSNSRNRFNRILQGLV